MRVAGPNLTKLPTFPTSGASQQMTRNLFPRTVFRSTKLYVLLTSSSLAL